MTAAVEGGQAGGGSPTKVLVEFLDKLFPDWHTKLVGLAADGATVRRLIPESYVRRGSWGEGGARDSLALLVIAHGETSALGPGSALVRSRTGG